MLRENQPVPRARTGPALLVLGAVLVTLASAWVDLSTSAGARAAAEADPGVWSAGVGLALVATGTVVLNGRPGHLVGVVIVAFGYLWAVDGLFESYTAFGVLSGRPGTGFAFWFVERFGAYLLVAVPALLLLYPTGRFIAGPWRRVSLVAFAMAMALPTMLVLAPSEVLYKTQPAGVPEEYLRDFISLPIPDGVASALLVVSRVATLAAVLLALTVVAVRHRRSDSAERTQLRWLLWAGIICVLAVVTMSVFPSGAVTYVAVAGSMITVAVSVAIGILRPDLADIDALVAGTLVYAGVAGAVLAIDFAAVAAASSLLGDRLDQRDVTILVVVLAVAVYGPLRTWIGAAVRRLLFGSRGDRYEAVSSLAARLEQTTSLEDQLPALAAAVADTFKVRFVRVEVFEPDGSTLSATHGIAPDDVYELGIDYRGESVGRLVLPRQGFRSMLSRRDQHLLVDLVRQAAIAVRGATLARQLQDSRERLVLGREDDRRRIRRDLHDGLGPVLGGVAMRLDAAGNALATDPDQARALIKQSRTDIGAALDDVRTLVHDLRPPALDDLGLLAAVEQQADRARSVLAVEVSAGALDGLPAAVEVAAFRIVSEALTNVVKHAAASRCDIELVPERHALLAVVRDDGRGIAENVSAGVGLLSMRERAEELGGSCEVSCPPTGGTQVRAWLPYGQGARNK